MRWQRTPPGGRIQSAITRRPEGVGRPEARTILICRAPSLFMSVVHLGTPESNIRELTIRKVPTSASFVSPLRDSGHAFDGHCGPVMLNCGCPPMEVVYTLPRKVGRRQT